MKKFKFTKFLSSILAFFMVLSLLVPLSSASAEESKLFKQDSQSESIIQLKAAIAEQLSLSKDGPTLHESLQNVSGNQDVAVIVHLSEKPVALEQGMSQVKGQKFSNARENEVRSNVKAQQAEVKKELATKKVQMTQGYTFDTVLNGFAATVKANDLPKLLTVEGITLIEPDAIVYASEDKPMKSSELNKEDQLEARMNTSNSFLGIEQLWKEGIEGQGIKVAVLDTGIDVDHPEFVGVYKGGKNFIPNSATYTKPRADNDASETLPSERPVGTPEFNEKGSSFYTSHGTHVAGTIAAIGANEFGIKGIAPKVDLYAYRVLGAYGSGATSGIVKAIETAVKEKMDVINLSLGGGANSETDAGSFAINNAMMAGTIGVIATGNEGPNRGTMGTPATARLGIAVGNTSNPETMYNGEVNVTVGNYNLTKQLPLMGTTFGKNLVTQLQGEFDLVAVPGNGEVKDFEGINVKGKVALISRGSIAFVDKIANAKANGAVATIIHNFAGGTNAPNISGTFLGDAFDFLPTFDMSQTDGDAIRTALAGGTGKVSFSKFASTKTLGDDVNSSSSRGPSTPNFDIKPDVSAPGTNIMSTIPMYKKDFPAADYREAYARKTGTSMATPHITGIVALVKQANPDWNAFDVKVALSNTAKVLDKTKYDVFSQGAGRVDAYAAAHPEILAYALDSAILDGTGAVSENLKGTVTFGPQSLKDRDISVTKQVLVKDIKGNGGNYNVSIDVTKTFGDATVTVDQPTFNLVGEQVLNITLTASQATAPKGSEILGYIYISSGDTEISLPFAADFGGAAVTELKDFKITETDLSFNGDGVKDSAVLSFTLTGDVTTNYIELWDIMNPKGGEYGDGYIGYLHAGTALGKGSYTLNIGGQYKPWGTAPATTIPDGLYTIDFTGLAASGVVSDYVGPIIVKTTKPEITGSVAEGVATGQVKDKYIDYNEELYLYGLNYNLNDKLKASYILTVKGEVQAPVAFELNQDGSFTFPVTAETNAVSVIIKDAAGNVGEAKIYENEVVEPVIALSVNPTKLDLTAGETAQLTVTETSTPAKGDTTEEDVTSKATYVVGNENVATIVNGLVTAVGEGTTTITVSYGDNEVPINVTVKAPVVKEPIVTLEIDQAQVETRIGKEVPVKITEVTTFDGKITEKDVTKLATYEVENDKIATVKAGAVKGKGQGNTTIKVKYGEHTLTFDVLVVKPGNGNGNGKGNGNKNNNEVTEDEL
ncbi:peptidase S8 [Lysinibacillus sphaericus]|uniref:Peptidase S8 n=1 Tax=Lysinibacillus sphaericus TaxID=1421 RepID=A0A544U803_LYSSH|nr:S8 family serine peptidase [Lysinibacillus sp. SDF0037]TQR27691.1 peptidase S8 [Lysinibacillus sp. SDF0037]